MMKLFFCFLILSICFTISFSESGIILDNSGKFYFISLNESNNLKSDDYVYIIEEKRIIDSLKVVFVGKQSSLAEISNNENIFPKGQKVWLKSGTIELGKKITLCVKNVQDRIVYFENIPELKVGDLLFAKLYPEKILHPVLNKEISLGDYKEIFIKITNKDPITLVGLLSSTVTTLKKGDIIEAQIYIDY